MQADWEPPQFHKRPKVQCEQCLRMFNRANQLADHQAKPKVKCTHCPKVFCNQDMLQKSEAAPVSKITDIHQMIQPETAYGGDVGVSNIPLRKTQ